MQSCSSPRASIIGIQEIWNFLLFESAWSLWNGNSAIGDASSSHFMRAASLPFATMKGPSRVALILVIFLMTTLMKAIQLTLQQMVLFPNFLLNHRDGPDTAHSTSIYFARDPNATLFWTCSDEQKFDQATPYSGMWWMPTSKFLKMDVDSLRSLEDASFAAFEVADVVMARDWLDFSVEHTSRYLRHLGEAFAQEPGSSTFETLQAMHTRYLTERQTQAFQGLSSAAQETLAILPVYASDEELSPEGYLDVNQVPRRPAGQSDKLNMYALATTLVSLQQIGMGRAVVVGHKAYQPELVSAAFALTQRASGQQPMALDYVFSLDKSIVDAEGAVNMPKIALTKVQQAFKGELDKTERRRIFGTSSKPWKYVYFSEPDLILHTRPSALEPLTKQLEDGKLMAAHRWESLPHAADFHSYFAPSRLVPNAGNFSHFTNLDPTTDACCDRGDYYPGKGYSEKCPDFWHRCGFGQWYENETEEALVQKNFRLQDYPMIRLASGIGAAVFNEHGRVCRPIKGGHCDE